MEKTDSKSTKRTLREPSENLYRTNLEALDQGMGAFLEKIEEVPIPIDEDIHMPKLNNPIYTCIIGFSTDLIARAVLKQQDKKVQYLLIIEPNVAIFKQTLKRFYCADLLANSQIDFLVGIPQDQLPLHIKATFSIANDKEGARAAFCQSPEILFDPFSLPQVDGKHNPITQSCIDAIVQASSSVFTSMGCASDSHWRWIQTVRNTKHIREGWNIKPLYGKFTETPVVVIGGGPSSEEFIEKYKNSEELKKYFLISCDAMLPRLLREGIRPNIVTRCERKLTTIFGDTRKEDTKGIYYAAYTWTPPEFFDLFDDYFVLFRNNGINKWTDYGHGAVDGGVSSANAALELAFLLGFQKIILTGIDLCFIDDKSHTSGTMVEFDLSKSEKKWVKGECNDGEERVTIPVWQRCKFEYETAFNKHESLKVDVVTTSKKGLKILGLPFKAWDEILLSEKAPLINWRAKIEALRVKIDESVDAKMETKRAETIAYLKEIVAELDKLFSFTDDAMLTGKREEQRLCQQLKAHSDPTEIFNNTESIKKSLHGVYKEPCRQIDNFKSKHYPQKLFWHVILDTCQLDFYHAENRMHSIRNVINLEHERAKSYVAVHTLLYRCMYYYAKRMIKLFEMGPDQKDIEYNPEIEVVGAVDIDTKLMDQIDSVIDRAVSSQKRHEEAPKILIPHVMDHVKRQYKGPLFGSR